jgi:hypothetical protein
VHWAGEKGRGVRFFSPSNFDWILILCLDFWWNELGKFGEDLVGVCEGYLERKMPRLRGNFGCVVPSLGLRANSRLNYVDSLVG